MVSETRTLSSVSDSLALFGIPAGSLLAVNTADGSA